MVTTRTKTSVSLAGRAGAEPTRGPDPGGGGGVKKKVVAPDCCVIETNVVPAGMLSNKTGFWASLGPRLASVSV